MLKPKIFVSAVTSEFGTLRKMIADILIRLGYDPELQDVFGTEPGDLRQMLRDKIDDCDGLVQIVGHAYGAEPPAEDPAFGRVSYAQFELLYAERQRKKTWVIIAGDGCTRDTPREKLDLPHGSHVDPVGRQLECRALQDAYRQRLKASGHLRHTVETNEALALSVERMRDDFAELRRNFRAWQRWVARSLIAILLLLALTIGTLAWNYAHTAPKPIAPDAIITYKVDTESAVAEVTRTLAAPFWQPARNQLESELRRGQDFFQERKFRQASDSFGYTMQLCQTWREAFDACECAKRAREEVLRDNVGEDREPELRNADSLCQRAERCLRDGEAGSAISLGPVKLFVSARA